MSQSVFTNARVVLPDEIIEGTVAVRDGRIIESWMAESPRLRRRTWRGTISFPASSSSIPITSKATTTRAPAWPGQQSPQ